MKKILDQPFLIYVFLGIIIFYLIYKLIRIFLKSEKELHFEPTFRDVIDENIKEEEFKILNKPNSFLTAKRLYYTSKNRNGGLDYIDSLIEEFRIKLDEREIERKSSDEEEATAEYSPLKISAKTTFERNIRANVVSPTDMQKFNALLRGLLQKNKLLIIESTMDFNSLKSTSIKKSIENITDYIGSDVKILHEKLNKLEETEFFILINEISQTPNFIVIEGRFTIVYDSETEYYQLEVLHPVSKFALFKKEIKIALSISKTNCDVNESALLKKWSHTGVEVRLKILGKSNDDIRIKENIYFIEIIPFVIFI